MAHPLRVAALPLVTAALVACGANHAAGYIAPSPASLEFGSEEMPDSSGQWVYVINRSSAPIVVTRVELIECVNVRTRCEAADLHVRVAPGRRENLLVVRAVDATHATFFKFNYTWAPGAPPPEPPAP